MTDMIISSLITSDQVRKLDAFLNNDFDNLEEEVKRLVYKIVDLAVYASVSNKLIRLQETDRVVIDNVIYPEKFFNNNK